MTYRIPAFFYACLAALLGGAMPVAVKIGVQAVTPECFSFFRAACCAAAVAAAIWIARPARPSWNGLPLLLLASTASFGNVILFAYGIKTVGPALSQILYLLCPLLVYIWSVAFTGEKLTVLRVSGVAAGSAGAAITVVSRSPLQGDAAGVGLILLAVFSHSLFLLLSRPVHKSFSALHQTLVMSMVFMVLFGFLWNPWNDNQDLSALLSSRVLTSILYVGILGTAAYILIIQHLVKTHSPVAASTILYIQPALTALWSRVFFSEEMGPLFFLGAVLATAGAWLATANQLPFRPAGRPTA